MSLLEDLMLLSGQYDEYEKVNESLFIIKEPDNSGTLVNTCGEMLLKNIKGTYTLYDTKHNEVGKIFMLYKSDKDAFGLNTDNILNYRVLVDNNLYRPIFSEKDKGSSVCRSMNMVELPDKSLMLVLFGRKYLKSKYMLHSFVEAIP